MTSTPFRLLHTSDWHLGLTVHRFERIEQQRDMLRQIGDIAAREHVDALIVSGDLFNVSQPSAQVQQMFSDEITAIRNSCPDMAIIITAGNHDSASRHEVFRTPLELLGIYVIGSIADGLPESVMVNVGDKGFVAAVPYVHERNLPDNFYSNVLAHIESLNTGGLPVVLMAHTAVHGCRFRGHSGATERTIGGIDSVDVASLGTGYDYLALGHIHLPHTLPSPSATARARYSGSPIAVSFDEDYAHSVTLVEIASHGATPTITEIPINDPCPMVTIPSEGFTDLDSALAELKEYPDDQEAYLRLNVEVDDYLPTDAEERARTISKDKKAQFCLINARRRSSDTDDEEAPRSFTVSEFRSMDVADIAGIYLTEKGVEFSDELRQMLSTIIDECNED